MSDFLFRMVERAAGLDAGTPAVVHRPFPGTAQNRFTATAPFHDLAPFAQPAPLPVQPADVRGTLQDTEQVRVSLDRVVRSHAPPSTQSRVANTPRPFTPKNTADDVLPEIAPEETPTGPPKPVAVDAIRKMQEFSPVLVNAVGKTAAPAATALIGEGRMPAQDTALSYRTAKDAVAPPSQPSKTLLSTRTANPTVPLTEIRQPLPTVPPVDDRKHAAAGTPTEIQEPAVEVKIGRVEIRFDAPAPAAPTAPPQPRGFSEYAALRTYSVRPRFSRSR